MSTQCIAGMSIYRRAGIPPTTLVSPLCSYPATSLLPINHQYRRFGLGSTFPSPDQYSSHSCRKARKLPMDGSGVSRRPLILTRPCLASCSCGKKEGRGGRGGGEGAERWMEAEGAEDQQRCGPNMLYACLN